MIFRFSEKFLRNNQIFPITLSLETFCTSLSNPFIKIIEELLFHLSESIWTLQVKET